MLLLSMLNGNIPTIKSFKHGIQVFLYLVNKFIQYSLDGFLNLVDDGQHICFRRGKNFGCQTNSIVT